MLSIRFSNIFLTVDSIPALFLQKTVYLRKSPCPTQAEVVHFALAVPFGHYTLSVFALLSITPHSLTIYVFHPKQPGHSQRPGHRFQVGVGSLWRRWQHGSNENALVEVVSALVMVFASTAAVVP